MDTYKAVPAGGYKMDEDYTEYICAWCGEEYDPLQSDAWEPLVFCCGECEVLDECAPLDALDDDSDD